jgi:pimeloyl-ACP methyl ester carboxylesterase
MAKDFLSAGIEAARSGDLKRASSLLSQAVQADPASEQGWLWLGQCLSMPDQRMYCFRRVLALNPHNQVAQQLLQITSPATPVTGSLQRTAPSQLSSMKKPLVAMMGVLVGLLVCGTPLAYLVESGRLDHFASAIVTFVRTPTAIVPSPTPTAISSTATSTPTLEPTKAISVWPTPKPTPLPTLMPMPRPTVEQAQYATFMRTNCLFQIPRGATVECGFVAVPEDRNGDPTGTIGLAVAIYRSTSHSPAPDPVIFLQGGPGSSAIEWITSFYAKLIVPILKERDFIVFDPRGTGFSQPPLDCTELRFLYLQDLKQDLPADEREKRYTEALDGCRDRLVSQGVNLSTYTSAANAADVKDIITALGYKQANLYAVSYGTRSAQIVMRDFPEIVHSAVLDSVVPIEVKLYNETSASSDDALQVLFNGCAANAKCNAAYPDLDKVFYDVVRQLDANPITVKATNPSDKQIYSFKVSGVGFTSAILWGLHSSYYIPILPKVIYRAHKGDYTFLSTAMLLPLQTYADKSIGTLISVYCHEQVLATTPQELEANLATHPNTEAFALSTIFGSCLLS